MGPSAALAVTIWLLCYAVQQAVEEEEVGQMINTNKFNFGRLWCATYTFDTLLHIPLPASIVFIYL